MTDERPADKKRSRRIYVCWGAALALLLTAGLFCWKVAVPVLRVRAQVRAAVGRYMTSGSPRAEKTVRLEVDRLGGPGPALRKLSLYLRLPEDRQSRQVAACLLSGCGEEAVPRLRELLLEEDEANVRAGAAWALGEIGGARAVRLLEAALKDESDYVRGAAEIGLNKIRARSLPTNAAPASAAKNEDAPR